MLSLLLLLAASLGCFAAPTSLDIDPAGQAGSRSGSFSGTPNPFYSEYDPAKFNYSGPALAVGDQTDAIQFKMNCYGYALRFVLFGQATMTLAPGGGLAGCLQQPGDFASAADRSLVRTPVYGIPADTMADLVYNMQLDASRLGYSVVEYVPDTSVVAQFGSYNRLIAVVAGTCDYHFYMQHNDGTWSHKPGSSYVTNLSFGAPGSQQVLTNSNIRSLAATGIYTGGCVKFFVVTRDAVLDHPHFNTAGAGLPQNLFAEDDVAGDYFCQAVSANAAYVTGRLDFSTDEDIFYYDIVYSGLYYVWITTDSWEGISCEIYDMYGTLLAQNSGDDMFCVEQYLSSGLRYYLLVRNLGVLTSGYLIEID